jgi:hypothetical protein
VSDIDFINVMSTLSDLASGKQGDLCGLLLWTSKCDVLLFIFVQFAVRRVIANRRSVCERHGVCPRGMTRQVHLSHVMVHCICVL